MYLSGADNQQVKTSNNLPATKMILRSILIYLCLLFLNACQQPVRLRVAVAANAQQVAQVLKKEFEKETGVDLELIVNSSGKITAQVEQGAPYDVFLSADTKYPQALYAKGLTLGPPRIYGYGKLIVWTNRYLDVNQPLATLLASSKGKVAIANPQSAPYGEAALQVLAHYGLQEQVQGRLVLGESVAQVNQYILSGVADLGFTAQSMVLEPAMKGEGTWKEIDAAAYTPIAQSAVLLRSPDSGKSQEAQQFYEFLFSLKAQAIFKRYGYGPAAPGS
jgi:molybdate transport system substrate-binding protein